MDKQKKAEFLNRYKVLCNELGMRIACHVYDGDHEEIVEEADQGDVECQVRELGL